MFSTLLLLCIAGLFISLALVCNSLLIPWTSLWRSKKKQSFAARLPRSMSILLPVSEVIAAKRLARSESINHPFTPIKWIVQSLEIPASVEKQVRSESFFAWGATLAWRLALATTAAAITDTSIAANVQKRYMQAGKLRFVGTGFFCRFIALLDLSKLWFTHYPSSLSLCWNEKNQSESS